MQKPYIQRGKAHNTGMTGHRRLQDLTHSEIDHVALLLLNMTSLPATPP